MYNTTWRHDEPFPPQLLLPTSRIRPEDCTHQQLRAVCLLNTSANNTMEMHLVSSSGRTKKKANSSWECWQGMLMGDSIIHTIYIKKLLNALNVLLCYLVSALACFTCSGEKQNYGEELWSFYVEHNNWPPSREAPQGTGGGARELLIAEDSPWWLISRYSTVH